MIIESMNEYLEILTGHVYDNDKVVTYKWLSKELEVHVNIAKEVLWQFWQRHKGEKNIECTVMLIGNLKSGGMRVEVVRESNLSTAKQKFSDIKSEHLYSIQKSIPDLESLATYDKGDVRFSAIKCKESIERSDEELAILQWGSLFKDRPVPKEEEILNANEKSIDVKVSDRVENNLTNAKSTNKKTTPVSQKTGFNNLFAKVPNKEKNSNTSPLNKADTKAGTTQSSVDKQSLSSKESKPITSEKKDKKSLASFFERSVNDAKDIHSKVSLSKEKQADCNTKNNIKEQILSTNSNESNQSKEATRGKKRNRSKESKHMIKKRKRIIVTHDVSDSESEDDEMKSESELELEPEPEPEPELEIIQDKEKSPSPPRVIHNKGKARILKVVDKTYEEDGFLVTKKVHVYESCSEDEMTNVEKEVPKKQESTSAPKAQAKKKQTTLINFFKK